jgi:hypothetical protein
VEPLTLSHERLQAIAEASSAAERIPAATTAHQTWQPPNVHDHAVMPLHLVVSAARTAKSDQPRQLLQRKLAFALECGLIPESQRCAIAAQAGLGSHRKPHSHSDSATGHWRVARDACRYRVDCRGVLDGGAAELFRLLAMDAKSFRAFRASVRAWRPNVSPPCALLRRGHLRQEFEACWTALVLRVLIQLRAAIHLPSASIALLQAVVRSFLQREPAGLSPGLLRWLLYRRCRSSCAEIVVGVRCPRHGL